MAEEKQQRNPVTWFLYILIFLVADIPFRIIAAAIAAKFGLSDRLAMLIVMPLFIVFVWVVVSYRERKSSPRPQP